MSKLVKFTLCALSLTAMSAFAQSTSPTAQSPLPLAQNFLETSQLKVRAAGHWKAMAQDIAQKTMASLEQAGYPDAPLYVAQGKQTDFETAFNEFLVTNLVNSGAKVQTVNADAMTVSYSAQVVTHNSERVDFEPWRYTMLTGGLWVLSSLAMDSVSGAKASLLALSVIKDHRDSRDGGKPTLTEVVLTTTITHGNSYLVRSSDVYYIENADVSLFLPPVPVKADKELKVTQ